MSVARELNEDQVALVEELRTVRAESAALRDREANLKEQILAMLDGADLGCSDGAELVRAVTTWRVIFDIKRFRADPMYGHLAPHFEKQAAVVSVKLT